LLKKQAPRKKIYKKGEKEQTKERGGATTKPSKTNKTYNKAIPAYYNQNQQTKQQAKKTTKCERRKEARKDQDWPKCQHICYLL
jgi:hypothetical protein